MELSRQEYPALLRSLQPNQAVAVVDDRVRSVAKVNSDIAEFLAERRKVEEAYAAGLKKLVGRWPQDVSSELGIFRTPWQSIVSSTETLSQSHALLAQKIEADVERPLRGYNSKNREMQGMSTIQGNLASVARDVDTARKRADKTQSGKTSQNKIDNATSDFNVASQQWESQAPYVFEQLQALDENRVNHLRDVLTQFQTHEVDLVERNRVSAESCLNAILNVNTSDEISTFVARTSTNAPAVPPSRPKSRSASGQPLSVRPRTGSTGDRASALSGTSGGTSRAETIPPVPSLQSQDSPRRPGGFGLKRLGTVIGRRKDKKEGPPPPDKRPSPEKRTRSGLNPLRRGSSKNMQEIPSPPETSTLHFPPSTPTPEPPLPESATTTLSQRPHSPVEQQRLNDQLNGDTTSPAPRRTSSLPRTNGGQVAGDLVEQDVPPMPFHPKAVETQRDTDGFNVPPSANDDVSRAQQEAAALGENEAPQFKLDIRDEPIQEEGDAQSALSNVANTLRAQAQQVATPRKPSGNRGRRDVRNTMFIPTPQPPDVSGTGDSPTPASLPFPSRSATLPTEASHGSDAQSIRSSHSLSSLMPVGTRHPEMTQQGLNASIVETVSATFIEGKVDRAFVIGELALAHNASDGSLSSGSESIRLENFPVLEKVAPNPTFITQAPSRSGEYTVNLSQIPRTTVAFKYQVHLDDASLASHAPVTPTSSWKIEPTQTSVMLQYGFNSSFASPSGRSVTLKNFTVLIHIEGAKTSSCMSKPVGTFSRDRAMMVWKLGDVVLDGYAAGPQKLLARFNTESEARPGTVELRWEISGEHAAGLGSGLSISRHAKDEGGSDPFADESTTSPSTTSWREVPLTRKIVSGKYIATGTS